MPRQGAPSDTRTPAFQRERARRRSSPARPPRTRSSRARARHRLRPGSCICGRAVALRPARASMHCASAAAPADTGAGGSPRPVVWDVIRRITSETAGTRGGTSAVDSSLRTEASTCCGAIKCGLTRARSRREGSAPGRGAARDRMGSTWRRHAEVATSTSRSSPGRRGTRLGSVWCAGARAATRQGPSDCT
jgi:hypothetical protein